MVLTSTGNSEITAATAILEPRPKPNQTSSTGASAILGMVCKATR